MCTLVSLAATGCDRTGLPGPRGLTAPRRCRGCGRSATPQGPRWRKAPARPGSRALCPSCPGAWRSARERKKGAALGRGVRPAAEHQKEGAIAAAQRERRRAGSRQPRARPGHPSCETFSFGFAPPEKCGPGGGGGRAGLPAAAAGEEEVVPAGARPGRGNARPTRRPAHPGPRPAATLAGRAPRGSVDGGGRCGPAARRSQQCGAGKTKGFHFASFPVFRQRSGAPRGIHGWRGPLPWGPLAARARLPRGTPLSPPPLRQRKAPRARTPGPGGSGHIVPAARGALGLGRGQSPCAHPPASGSKSRGRLGNCRRDAAAATALRTSPRSGFRFFFFANPDGKEGDRLLRIHQLSSQQQKSWRKRQPAGATSSGGRPGGTPQAGAHPRDHAGTRGRGRRPKMSSDAGSVSFALPPRPEWRSEARARRPSPPTQVRRGWGRP